MTCVASPGTTDDKPTNGHSQVEVYVWNLRGGPGEGGPSREEPGIEGGCVDTAPSVGCFGDRHEESFRTLVAKLNALFVTLLVEIDSPFLVFIKTKQKPPREKPTGHGFACHAAVRVTVALFQKKRCFLCFPSL